MTYRVVFLISQDKQARGCAHPYPCTMPTVKKAERTFWHKEATLVLRTQLAARRVSYKQLSRLLSDLGENEPEKTLSNKINRGTFSFIFFLKCIYALGRSDVRFLLSDLSPEELAKVREQALRQQRRRYPVPHTAIARTKPRR